MKAEEIDRTPNSSPTPPGEHAHVAESQGLIVSGQYLRTTTPTNPTD